jgi:hypothetical protein
MLLNVAVALVFMAGLLSAATGAWFVLGDHPFTGASQFSDEFGMTKAQIDAFNPAISKAVLADSARAGAVSLGWGMFVMVLAWLGLRNRHRLAFVALWAGGVPALLLSAVAEPMRFGTVEVGSVLSAVVLGVFLLGLLFAAPALRATRQDTSEARSKESLAAG